jgi:hypothetical protein
MKLCLVLGRWDVSQGLVPLVDRQCRFLRCASKRGAGGWPRPRWSDRSGHPTLGGYVLRRRAQTSGAHDTRRSWYELPDPRSGRLKRPATGRRIVEIYHLLPGTLSHTFTTALFQGKPFEAGQQPSLPNASLRWSGKGRHQSRLRSGWIRGIAGAETGGLAGRRSKKREPLTSGVWLPSR